MTIIWPPPYYLLRDRIPFFLTMFYMQRHHVPQKHRDLLGLSLLATTILCLGISLYLWIVDGNFMALFGFKWSVPSPVEWSIMVIALTYLLYQKEVSIFKSYYLSLITAIGGGWIWEISHGFPFWVRSGFAHWNMFKLNAVKVFYFEFQVICLPIVLYILRDMKYKRNKYLIPAIIGAAIFYLGNIQIAPYVNRINYYLFSWVLRVPTIIVLYLLLNGVQGDKK